MDLRHLRFFLALADELHFTRAAARLHVAQPHLSQEIRRLERELGVQLFRRTKRRVEITAAGEAFGKGATAVLAELQRAVDAAQRAERGEVGTLVVGFVGSSAWDLFPEAVRRFRVERADVQLVLREQTTVEELDALRRGTIDVALMRAETLEEHGLTMKVLRREPLVVALPRHHRFARKDRVALADFASEPWIAFEYSTGPGLYAQFLRACEAAGFHPRIAQTASHIPIMMSLVAGGLGVALVPAQVRSLRPRGVSLVAITKPAPMTAVVVGKRKDDKSPAVARFIALLQEEADLPQAAVRSKRR